MSDFWDFPKFLFRLPSVTSGKLQSQSGNGTLARTQYQHPSTSVPGQFSPCFPHGPFKILAVVSVAGVCHRVTMHQCPRPCYPGYSSARLTYNIHAVYTSSSYTAASTHLPCPTGVKNLFSVDN